MAVGASGIEPAPVVLQTREVTRPSTPVVALALVYGVNWRIAGPCLHTTRTVATVVVSIVALRHRHLAVDALHECLLAVVAVQGPPLHAAARPSPSVCCSYLSLSTPREWPLTAWHPDWQAAVQPSPSIAHGYPSTAANHTMASLLTALALCRIALRQATWLATCHVPLSPTSPALVYRRRGSGAWRWSHVVRLRATPCMAPRAVRRLRC